MKKCFETYLKEVMVVADEKDRKLDTVEDPDLSAWANEVHPRFYEFVAKYGSPCHMVNLKSEGTNIGATSVKMAISRCIDGQPKKTLNKKLLLNMGVTDLKATICKLFKIEVIEQYLAYKGPEDTQEYPLDEDFRQLSFYSMAEGGEIYVRHISYLAE